jgi:hypothetical protein
LNEAWVFSDAGDLAPETAGGRVDSFSEKYPGGGVRAQWRARICPGGRYLLDGEELDFYPDGAKQHDVTYASGVKTGEETFWSPEGKIRWQWRHDLSTHTAVWTQYWPNGQKHFESIWDTKPVARDLARSFFGRVANGPASEWDEDGKLLKTMTFTNGYPIHDLIKQGVDSPWIKQGVDSP